ncbi:MAG: serine/threonine-protein kinase, partial [Planctomycetota bacterium]
REAGILMKLEHPGIVRGYDLAEQERVWFCAMEFAEGRDLQAIVEDGGPLSEIEALRAVEKILEAVEYLDGRGIVHRDIKPGNILRDDQGNCRMIDLGLCMLTGGMKDDGTAGMTVGTVEYLSPEQAKAQADLDVRTDLYAIGASIHHLVTGRVPFQGEDDEETLAMQVLKTFRPTLLEEAGASPELIDLVTRLMAKDREDRPENARAVLDELRARWPALHPPAPAPIPLDAPAAAPASEPAPGPVMPKLVSKRRRAKQEDGDPDGKSRKKRGGVRKKRR